MDDHATVTSRSRTADNAANLAPAFLAEMQRRYGDTPLGRQELEGEIVEERMTGLWKRAWLDAEPPRRPAPSSRASSSPSIRRSPSTAGSDSCGIIVAGLGVDGRGYVIGDRTIQGREPATWAKAAVAAYHDYQADRIVVETNQGGDLVVQIFKSIDASVPVKKVHAIARQVPARRAGLGALRRGPRRPRRRVPRAGAPDVRLRRRRPRQRQSPDRLDALVWALTELMLTATRQPLHPLAVTSPSPAHAQTANASANARDHPRTRGRDRRACSSDASSTARSIRTRPRRLHASSARRMPELHGSPPRLRGRRGAAPAMRVRRAPAHQSQPHRPAASPSRPCASPSGARATTPPSPAKASCRTPSSTAPCA